MAAVTGHTTADVLRRVLSAGGVGSLYGRALPGFEVAAVADPVVAVLLAQAHCAIGGTRAVAHLGDGTFVVPGRGADGPVRTLHRQHVEVSDAATLFGLAPAIEEAARGAGLEIKLYLDLSAPSRDGPVERPASTADWLDDDALGEIPTLGTVVVLAGPGVVQDASVGGLRALAAAGRLGVLNTWGAKGVFHWQSRHHWATVGLQEHDFELGGLGSADLVLVTGVDEREAPPQSWAQFPHRIVAPGALAPLAERWPDGGSFPELPPLRPRLAAVTQAGWAATGVPLMPSLVTQHYRGCWVTAGSWRPTPERRAIGSPGPSPPPGSARSPYRRPPFRGGRRPVPPWPRLAAPLRPVLAVVDGPLDATTEAVLDAASALGAFIGVEAWTSDGSAPGPDEHLSRLDTLVSAGGVSRLQTDSRQLDEMVAVAGPVHAWAPG